MRGEGVKKGKGRVKAQLFGMASEMVSVKWRLCPFVQEV